MRGTRGGRGGAAPAPRFSPAYAGNTARASPVCRRSPVQPRVCGEHSARRVETGHGTGSAPRMRGTRPTSSPCARTTRFSPAYAGNTPFTHVGDREQPVQPRVCGEHSKKHARSWNRPGSAPRMRGTRGAGHLSAPPARFSPAYAGNTPGFRRSGRRASVQPRVCGEHGSRTVRTVILAGSAPRMRGTLGGQTGAARVVRFSPAYAGNTHAPRPRGCQPAVQPRVCGEHPRNSPDCSSPNGSAPRMRGTRRCRQSVFLRHRFSPAYAGNTRDRPPTGLLGSVQPRVCGEHSPDAAEAATQIGSAPRMRGTLEVADHQEDRGRFSPAYAGNTWGRIRASPTPTVQPRVCGEHGKKRTAPLNSSGSAPRMRGTRDGGGQVPDRCRFSPAYAGNTAYS